MADLLIYPRAQLPPELNWQIISFIRVNSPDALAGFEWFPHWMAGEGNDHSHHVMLVEHRILISHAEAVWKDLIHRGETYRAYGLTSVFTYPGLRRQGYGTQIVQVGTALIRRSNADIGIFTCHPRLERFYSRCGWIPMRDVAVRIEPEGTPIVVDEPTMMLFVSEKGKRNAAEFEREPVNPGERAW